eukprot:Sdes_comp15223_c0_seq1m4052
MNTGAKMDLTKLDTLNAENVTKILEERATRGEPLSFGGMSLIYVDYDGKEEEEADKATHSTPKVKETRGERSWVNFLLSSMELKHKLNHAIFPLGLTGSGKTKVINSITKEILNQSKSSSKIISEDNAQASILLEAFGNAKTSNNINSTRHVSIDQHLFLLLGLFFSLVG